MAGGDRCWWSLDTGISGGRRVGLTRRNSGNKRHSLLKIISVPADTSRVILTGVLVSSTCSRRATTWRTHRGIWSDHWLKTQTQWWTRLPNGVFGLDVCLNGRSLLARNSSTSRQPRICKMINTEILLRTRAWWLDERLIYRNHSVIGSRLVSTVFYLHFLGSFGYDDLQLEPSPILLPPRIWSAFGIGRACRLRLPEFQSFIPLSLMKRFI